MKIGFGLVCAVALASAACSHMRSGKHASSSSAKESTSGAQAKSSSESTTVTGQAAQGSTAQGPAEQQPSMPQQGSAAGQSSSMAQGSTSAPSKKSVEGRVEQLDRAGNLTLAGTESAGHAFDRFKVDERTDVTVSGQKATLDQVNEGDEVRASFSGQGDQLHVDKLEILTKEK